MGEQAIVSRAAKPEREPRMSTLEHCVITRQNSTVVTAVLLNLSEKGFCVESSTPLENNERIEVRVLGARLEGAVKWTEGCRAGGTLHRAAV